MDEWTGMRMVDRARGDGQAVSLQKQAFGGQKASVPGAISGWMTGVKSEVSSTLHLTQTHPVLLLMVLLCCIGPFF